MLFNVTLEAAGDPASRRVETLEAADIIVAWSIALDTYYKPSDHPEFSPLQIVGIDVPGDRPGGLDVGGAI
jgi:hypothetical protein